MEIRTGHGAVSNLTADVCVVGAGPVGLALAEALERRGLRTLVLESGSRRPSAAGRALSDAVIRSPATHPDMSLAVSRGLGGATWLWGGRCLPLDPEDLACDRQAWPIGEAEVAPFYDEAANFLGCGQGGFAGPDTPQAAEWRRAGIPVDGLERWCNEPQLGRRFDKAGAGGPTVLLDTTVIGMKIGADGRTVEGLRIVSDGREAEFGAARAFVLACGGLETARLLLHLRDQRPDLMGGPDGALGRNYMGHVSGVIADLVLSDPEAARLFDYRLEPACATRRRLTLDRSGLADDRLPNIAFLPFNPKLGDASHGVGILSALFLLLSLPVVGRRLIAEAIRQSQMTGRPDYLAHLRNLIFDLPATVAALGGLLWQRVWEGRRKPFLFFHTRDGRYPLHYHAEHLPHPDSRASLDGSVDATGLQRLQIDLRYSEEDALGVVRAHQRLDERLRASGLGRLDYRFAPADRPRAVLEQARDGLHQIGLTRMGAEGRDGVVDADCRVFGLDNLFVAGSGVFRTSGQANPTYFAVALALRLAAHLKAELEGARMPGGFPDAFRLGFGCASLGSRVSANRGSRALARAFEQGVTWFDLAPSYGDGQAESIFAGFAAGKRDRIQICTKCGIAPPKVSGPARYIRPLLRLAVQFAPGLRRAVAARRPQAERQPLSAQLVETSIDGSLRRLGVEWVDVYALHDPDPADLRREDIAEALGRVLRSGKARAIGIAGSAEAAIAALEAGLPVGHIQVADGEAFERVSSLVAGRSEPPLVVTHSVFRGGGGEAALTEALARNRDGVVLASMFDERHLARNIAAARAFERGLGT